MPTSRRRARITAELDIVAPAFRRADDNHGYTGRAPFVRPVRIRPDHQEGSMDEQRGRIDDDPDDLLRRALIDPEASVAVALKVNGLALAHALTVVFHGRADLGTIQTYVAHGPLGAGTAVSADALLRVPCDLDLGDAESRDEAEEAYVEQARTLRDAIIAADTVLAIWQEPLSELAEGKVAVSRSIELGVRLAAHRLVPGALVAPDRPLPPPGPRGGAAPARGRGPPRRWASRARSRTSRTCTRCPTTPSAASRTSPCAQRTTRGGWPSASSTRRLRSGGSWS